MVLSTNQFVSNLIKQEKENKKKSKVKGKDEKRSKKDPNAPKKAATPYVIFMKENQERIKKNIPKGSNLFTAVANEWKVLKGADKKDLVKKAKEDKDRYERELSIFNQNKSAKKSWWSDIKMKAV
jgi:hypothetical protein